MNKRSGYTSTTYLGSFYPVLLGVLLISLLPSLAFGQADVIKASGGTNLSVDSVATQGYTTLDGPTIRETAIGQLASGKNIVLTLPTGYAWNNNLTGNDITITIAPTGAANTKLAVSFSSITANSATFHVDHASIANGNGQGPGRVEIQGLQLRPTTTNVPSTGQISNTGTTGPDKNYGNLSTAVGSITKVRVETAADGSGQIVPAQNLTAGKSITVYAIARDVGNNFVKNIALAASSDWSLTGGSGTIPQSAVTPSASLKSATFSSQTTGTTKIQAAYSGATSVTSGTLTVLPRSTQSMAINTQPSDTVTAGAAFPTQPIIFLKDQFGNKVTTDDTTQVTVSINSGNGTLSGTLTKTANAGTISFSDLYATIADTVTLKFESPGLSSIVSNEIVILPASAADLEYIQQPSNTAQNGTITPPVTLRLLDTYGNEVHQSGITVTLNSESFFNNSSTLSTATDANGIATFDNLVINNNATTGQFHLTAQFSGINNPVDSAPFEIISPTQLAKYNIEAAGGGNIGDQQAGTSFSFQISAINGAGNVKTDFSGSVTVTSDGDLQINSSPVDSFTASNFQSGVFDTTITITSSGITHIYADSGQTVSGKSNGFNVLPSNIISPDSSTITANPTDLTANGTSTSTITVQLKDEYGNNLVSGGENVQLFTTAGTFGSGDTTITANDNGDGTYSAVLTSSSTAGQIATITGTVNSTGIADSARVNFNPGEITKFIINLPQNNGSPAMQTAGVPFNIDVQAVDAHGNIVTGFNGNVTFSTNSVISSGSSGTFSNGILSSHSITLTKADSTTTLTVSADNLYNVSGTSASFLVVANSPDAGNSQVIANPSVLQNNTGSKSAISVILKDQYQNRVYTQNTVTFNLDQLELNNNPSSGSPDASLGSISYEASRGIYRDTLTATSTIELVQITASFNGTPIPQQPTVDIVVPNTWTANAGGPSGNRTDWTNPDNWSQGRVPTSSDYVIIPNIGDLPILDLNISMGSFEIQSGAALTLYGGNAITVSGNTQIDGSLNIEANTQISIGGNLVGAGSFSAGQSADISIGGNISLNSFLARTSGTQISLNGSSSQTISTGSFLAQNLNIQNNVQAISGNNLIDTSLLTITKGNTFELTSGISDTLDIAQDITGKGSLILNDNALVLRGNTDLNSLDASQASVIFGVRQGENPANYNLSQQQIANLSQMKNAVINNDKGVKTNGDIIVNGTLTLENGPLIIGSGKSLIAPNQIYNNGSLKILRTIQSKGWVMMSSPINSTFSDLFSGLTTQGTTGSDYPSKQPNILYYNETIPGTDNQRWRTPSDVSNSIQDPDSTGRGFFFYVFGNVSGDTDYNDSLPVTLSVTGQEYKNQSSTFNFSSVTYTAAADTGWNLVGNPWASTLDWDNSGWTKTNMDNVVYVWDPTTNSYLTWNGIDGSLGDGLIKPFQAFWVKANAQNPQLSVDRSAKTTGGTYYGKSKKQPASIGFKLTADSLEKQMFITLSPDGKNNKDPRDAYRLLPFDTQTYLEFYSTLANGAQVVTNNLARSFGKEISIPIHIGGFKKGTPINGGYTISWPKFGDVPQAWTLILEDKKTGEKIDLRKNTFYSFNVNQSSQKQAIKNTPQNFHLVEPLSKNKSTGSDNARFLLHIKPGADAAGLPNKYSLDINYPNPFSDHTTIKYETPVEGNVQLLVYDILGRKVKTIIDQRQPADFHEATWTPSQLASGVYILVMRAGGKQFTRKITFIK
ncbi:MAG TPA: invasin domain 3-containing protein [Balneolaceae bacterium]|nr:invasin domain 3-containing protein [Balneolaceae bacterium]